MFISSESKCFWTKLGRWVYAMDIEE